MRVPKLVFGLIGLLLAASILAACGGGSSSTATKPAASSGSGGATSTTIVIKNYAFHPTSLTVKPGATITVRNEDQTPHTVTAASPHSGAFNTGDIPGGSTKVFTAPSGAGSYPFMCTIHPFMTGTLTVS